MKLQYFIYEAFVTLFCLTRIPIEHLHSVQVYVFEHTSTVYCIDSCISSSPRVNVFLPEADNVLSESGKCCAIFKVALRSRNPFLLDMQ